MKKIMWFVILGCLLLSPMAVTAQADSQQLELDYYFDGVCNLTNLRGANIAAEGSFAELNYTSLSYKAGTHGQPVKVRLNNSANKPDFDKPAKERIKLDKTKTCACGDICVTTTGWWREGDAFHPSDTPIQSAVDNATASETICVNDGIYNENVGVDKPLTVRSENGAASTTVNAFDDVYPVFVVAADYVNISGFTVKGTHEEMQAGIYLHGAHLCIISDNTASSNRFGIGLEDSCNNELRNNTVSNNSVCGIWVSSSWVNTITNNTVSGSRYAGICLGGSCYNNIHSNIISNNAYIVYCGDDCAGILLYSSSSNNIYNNYLNNTNNAYDDGNNTWNITKKEGKNIIDGPYLGGNHWSDYAGDDEDDDGLGDMPYSIPPDTMYKNKDYLPLVPVGAASPKITSSTPESPVNDYVGATRAFNISINQTVDVNWQINGIEVQITESVTESSYTNTSAVIGTWNVSGIVSNANGTDMQTWVWTVTSPCFIATAAYGSPLHDDINVLRAFRDRYMMTNPVGQAMVKIYYTTSPPFADLIRANEGLRTTVRDGLVKPLVDVTRMFVV